MDDIFDILMRLMKCCWKREEDKALQMIKQEHHLTKDIMEAHCIQNVNRNKADEKMRKLQNCGDLRQKKTNYKMRST